METPPRRITLGDIANKLNVTHVAVSLALRDSPRISKALRQKVKDLANEMGYKPDPMLSALAQHRLSKGNIPIASAIAWINLWTNPTQLRQHQEFNAYWKGASSCAEKLGYYLEEFVVGPAMTAKRLQNILVTRNIRGILLTPTAQKDISEKFQDFDWTQFAVVRLGRSLDWPPCHIVTSDHTQNSMLAFQTVKSKGYRRIGFIGERSAKRHFSAGIMLAQLDIEKEEQVPSLLTDVHSPDLGTSVCDWLKAHQPDAIITEIPTIPEVLTQNKYHVPQDIALAGLSMLDGKIDAGIDQHSEEIGRLAIITLVTLFHDFTLGTPAITRQILVSGSWVDGESMPLSHF